MCVGLDSPHELVRYFSVSIQLGLYHTPSIDVGVDKIILANIHQL